MSSKRFPLAELVKATRGSVVHGDPESTGFSTFHIDSREVEEGTVFVPVHGERDGHQFIPDAIANGAPAVLFEESNEYAEEALAELDGDEDDPVFIEVEFTQQALYRLTSWYLTNFDVVRVAITGSVGKTTTKEFTAALLSELGEVHKSRASYNNEFGVPLTVAGLEDRHDYLVTEMGMRGLGEIQLLSSIVRPDLALITNVKESHIGRLGDLQGIATAKGEICFGLKQGVLFTPTGEELLAEEAERGLDEETTKWESEVGFGRRSFGVEKGDYRITSPELQGLDGSRFRFRAGEEVDPVEIDLPLLGSSSAYNFLAAAAIAVEAGLEPEELPRLAASLEPAEHRLQVSELPGEIQLIDDSYNASFSSTRQALQILASLPGEYRKVAVLGDMLELGGLTEQAHARVGELAAELNLDHLITVGYHSALTGNRFGQHNDSVVNFTINEPYSEEQHDEYFDSALLEKVTARLKDLIEPQTAVLVKASRALEFERICDAVREYAQTRWAPRASDDQQ